MLRRKKLLEMAAESPASGARFVGHGLEDSTFYYLNTLRHNQSMFGFSGKARNEHKN